MSYSVTHLPNTMQIKIDECCWKSCELNLCSFNRKAQLLDVLLVVNLPAVLIFYMLKKTNIVMILKLESYERRVNLRNFMIF